MIYRIFFIVFIIVITSCEEKNINVKISGVVKDEVTDELVGGVSVAIRIYFCEDGHCYSNTITFT